MSQLTTNDKRKNDYNMNSTASFYYKNEIPYTAIPKYYLKDKKLSLKAKGLLTIIYSLPDGWDYTMPGLAAISNISIKALRPIINELITKGYIDRTKKQDKKGRYYYEYWIEIEPFDTRPWMNEK